MPRNHLSRFPWGKKREIVYSFRFVQVEEGYPGAAERGQASRHQGSWGARLGVEAVQSRVCFIVDVHRVAELHDVRRLEQTLRRAVYLLNPQKEPAVAKTLPLWVSSSTT